MVEFSGLHRENIKRTLKEKEFDLVIIGGGITGAGIALDASASGMQVALIEMADFASGTSSRSTKLVHGGLRYLKQFEIKEVAELGREREIVYENGPHVTTPEWMLLPFHKGGTFGSFSTSLGLRVYDFLAGVKKSERRTMLSVEETLEKIPYLKKEGLLGSGYYVEYRTDDARLTIEVLKAAAEHGAHALNYLRAQSFEYGESGNLQSVNVQDQLSGETWSIRGRVIVNAAGPWVDQVRELDHSNVNKHLHLSKGVHLVFNQSVFPLEQAVYFDTHDGRMVFAIPRDGKTYVGTTDTFYDGDPADVHASQQDRDYLLKAIQDMFPDLDLEEKDVESSWAGVRPLIHEEGKGPSEISRKDEIWESKSGLITIAGGKLTGYRKMAETVVNCVKRKLADQGIHHPKASTTKRLPVSGGDMGGSAQFPLFISEQEKKAENMGFTKEEGKYLAKFYGTNVEIVFKLAQQEQQGTLLPRVLSAQLHYAIQYEMAMTPVDFFMRRTGTLLFHITAVHKWKAAVVEKMAKVYAWSDSERETFTKELENELQKAEMAKAK